LFSLLVLVSIKLIKLKITHALLADKGHKGLSNWLKLRSAIVF